MDYLINALIILIFFTNIFSREKNGNNYCQRIAFDNFSQKNNHSAEDSIFLKQAGTELEDSMPVDKAPSCDLDELKENTVYPEFAKKYGIEGKVSLRANIGSSGEILKAIPVDSGSVFLVGAAISTIMKTKFYPAIQKGKQVESLLTIPISFSLKGKEHQKYSIIEMPDSLFYCEASKGGTFKVAPGVTVILHYTAYKADGTIIASTATNGVPFIFVYGVDRMVMKGLVEGIKRLGAGGRRLLFIPKSMQSGTKPNIGTLSGEPLIIDIEVEELG